MNQKIKNLCFYSFRVFSFVFLLFSAMLFGSVAKASNDIVQDSSNTTVTGFNSQMMGTGGIGWNWGNATVNTISIHLSGSGTLTLGVGCRITNDGFGNYDSTCNDNGWSAYTMKMTDTVTVNGEADYTFTISGGANFENGKYYIFRNYGTTGTINFYYDTANPLANSYAFGSSWYNPNGSGFSGVWDLRYRVNPQFVSACTSYVYSNWSSCYNNSKSRSVVSTVPSICSGGATPDLTTTCTDFFTYSGDNPNYELATQSLPTGKNISYNICSNFDTDNDYIISYIVNGVEVSRGLISSSACSYSGNYFQMNNGIESSGTSTLAIFSKPYVLNESILDASFSVLTPVISSNEFRSVVANTDFNVGTSYIQPTFDGNLRVDTNATSTTATTTITYKYDLCSSSEDVPSGQVCLTTVNDNFDYVSTVGCQTPTACGGTMTFGIPTGSAGDFSHYRFVWKNSFSVVKYSGLPFDVAFWTSAQPNFVTNDTELYGTSSAMLACTADEWASSDNAFGFNTTKMKCYGLTAFYSGVSNFKKIIETVLSTLFSGLSYLFPFNIPAQIEASWKASALAPVPSAFAFLNVTDSSGNVAIKMPHQWAGGSIDVSHTVLGRGGMLTGNDASSPFAKLLSAWVNFTVFINWGVLALVIIYFSIFVIRKMTDDDRQDD